MKNVVIHNGDMEWLLIILVFGSGEKKTPSWIFSSPDTYLDSNDRVIGRLDQVVMEWNLKYVRVSGDWSSNGISRMDRRGVSSAFVRWMRLGMHVPTNWQNPNMHFQIECNFLYLLVPKFLASLYRYLYIYITYILLM